MKVTATKLTLQDFKKVIKFFDEDPSWLGQYSSKASNGEYITYPQVCDIALECIKEKEMGIK